MCGIFALLNNDGELSQDFIETEFKKGSKRGPEFSILTKSSVKADFGFHRLAINGLNSESNQPIVIDGISLICNGEIYNYKELYSLMTVMPTTDSDCEVIIHLYKLYGIEQALQMLDGVFSFALIDTRITNPSTKLYIARDPYGVRPLYYMKPTTKYSSPNNIYGFASELKVLSEICGTLNNQQNGLMNTSGAGSGNTGGFFNRFIKSDISYNGITKYYSIVQFQPGTYSTYELLPKVSSNWEPLTENIRYHSTGFQSIMCSLEYEGGIQYIIKNIQYYLVNAVRKRCVTTERPIACLLSGGLDSSLITALVQDYHNINGFPPVETYSIGLVGSEDLHYARIVADYLGTKHTEIILSEQDFLDAIPNVIRSIESYDTTTVRASIGNWLLGKYISENSNAKVIFNGDGSDELMGGYLYMNACPDSIEFDRESKRLLSDIHAFDVLRSDKSISSHGLEPRTPFLDRSWVQYFLSIHPDIRNHKFNNMGEKYLVRNAFSYEHYTTYRGEALLPDEILWRRKEAFSDGVSKTTRSLYEIIQEYTDLNAMNVDVGNNYGGHLIPTTSEQKYYRRIFDEAYPGLATIVPYFWMPKYVDAKDASARTLQLYNSDSNNVA
uniref:asparagine synthase (glutamine-hydrolyzing) n=1 Tax=viral metagenome TaxID=1070528 RepID=A0A6C0DR78_9ZZZZ